MSADHEGPQDTVAARVRHLETLLEKRGLVEATGMDEALRSFLARASPAAGGRIVARAWLDPAFRTRLLTDANAAVEELGLSMAAGMQDLRLRVVENTPTAHNVIVCTLCSCYPLALLGPSPSWYKSDGYRSRVVHDPRGVLREFGFEVEPDVRITVWDASAETRYMVLPRRPVGTEDASEQALSEMVTRNGLIGVAPV
jgi:nitrile hydratase